MLNKKNIGALLNNATKVQLYYMSAPEMMEYYERKQGDVFFTMTNSEDDEVENIFEGTLLGRLEFLMDSDEDVRISIETKIEEWL